MSATAFLIIAVFTLAGALAAACLRKLIHAALCLVLAFLGLAAFYFLLGAEFVRVVEVKPSAMGVRLKYRDTARSLVPPIQENAPVVDHDISRDPGE